MDIEALDRASSLDRLAEIAMVCAQLRLKKVLIERKTTAAENSDVLLSTVAEYVRLSPGIRVAVIGDHLPAKHDLEYVISYVKLDGADFKCFSLYDEAETWLLT